MLLMKVNVHCADGVRVPVVLIALHIRTGICHVAKFKACQIVLGTDSPNLMLAKVSHFTVYSSSEMNIISHQ